MSDIVNNTMEYSRIEDDNNFINEEDNHTTDIIDNILLDLNNSVSEKCDEIKDIEYRNSYNYPIAKNMFIDLNYHARTHMYVNLHICPYQVRESTDRTPFLQYIMKLTENKYKITNENEDFVIDFNKRTYFDIALSEINLMNEATTMLKIIMASYRILLTDNKYDYIGFRKIDNDFYVFFDVTKSWINHHYLSLKDPLWLTNMYELTVIGEVGPHKVSTQISDLFSIHYPDLLHLYDNNEKQIPMPIVGYTVEERKNMDWTMTFGTQPVAFRKNDGEYNKVFMYYYAYDACCSDIKNKNDIENPVIMRHSLMYDKASSYEDYENNTIEDLTDDNLLVTEGDNDNDNVSGMFVLRKHGNQTPLTTHNTYV